MQKKRRSAYYPRAYMDDPKTFERYAPVAEKLLCLAAQADLNDYQMSMLVERAAGNSLAMVDPVDGRSGTLVRRERSILSRLSKLDSKLMLDYVKLRSEPMPAEAIRAKRFGYRISKRGQELARARRLRYEERRRKEKRLIRAKPAPAPKEAAATRYAPDCVKYYAMLGSSDDDDRYEALIALGRRGFLPALPTIRSIARDRGGAGFVRREAVATLGELKDRASIPFLKSIIESDAAWRENALLAEALVALGKIKAIRSVVLLSMYVDSKDEIVRNKVRQVLKDIGQPPVDHGQGRPVNQPIGDGFKRMVDAALERRERMHQRFIESVRKGMVLTTRLFNIVNEGETDGPE